MKLTKSDVLKWIEAKEQLETCKQMELALRKKVAKTLVPEPVEGANTVEFEGVSFTFTHAINRSIDEAALDSVMADFPEDSPYRKPDNLIKYKPALVVGTYRAMSEQDRKHFEQALKISDGAPKLEYKKDPRTVWGKRPS